MSKRVFLGNKAIVINPSTSLGAGGQAIVVKEGKQALKIWHQPDKISVAKVEYLIKKPPRLASNILLPQDLLRDAPNGQVVGYTMKLLPKDFRELAVLFNRKLRKNMGVELPQVARILTLASQDLLTIHQQQIVVGDLSGRNVAFVATPTPETFWYDTDSWVVANMPCPVWSEFFVDPKLRKGTSINRDFSTETDWYSMAVIAFWSLFYSHPFHGQHDQLEDPVEKASNGLWLFDKKVTPPSFSLPAEIISDELLQAFYQFFVKDTRPVIPSTLFKELENKLVKCSSCGNWYYQGRGHCPVCTKSTGIPTFVVISLHTLLKSQEELVFVRYQDKTLFAISHAKSRWTLHIKESVSTQKDVALPNFPIGSRFEIVGNNLLAVNHPGEEEIILYDFIRNKEVTTTTSQFFAGNRHLAFRGTEQGILRLAGRQLLKGEVKHDRLIDSELPVSTTPEQTWFWSDPTSGNVFGLLRVFDRYQFWLVTKRRRIELNLPQLQIGETLLDINVRFSKQSVLLLRLIQKQGISYVLTHVISVEGQILVDRRERLNDLPFNPLHGGAYDHQISWYATDQGLMKHDLLSNTLSLIDKTAKAVTSADSVYHLGGHKHFLIIKDKEVDYLILP